MTCNLNCYLPTAATAVVLPNSTGINTDIGVPDLTLEECRRACRAFEGCEAVVHTASGIGKCYGKKNIRTAASEGGCQVQQPYITEMVCGMPWGKCMLLGDPHITTFDRKMLGSYPPEEEEQDFYMVPLDMYESGEYHLVVANGIDIQARFGFASAYRSASSTMGVAAGGALLGGSNIAVAYVGPAGQDPVYKGWKVMYNEQVILRDFPSSFISKDGLLNATFANMEPTDFAVQARSTIGTAPGLLPSYVFELANSVQIYVLPGPDLCNVVISMRKIPGQHGYCGDFNCNRADDTMQELEKRGLNKPVGTEQSLFPSGLKSPAGWDIRSGPSPSQVLAQCPESVKQQSGCAGKTQAEQESCLFDKCVTAVNVAAHMQKKFDGASPLRDAAGRLFDLRWRGGTLQTCASSAAALGGLAVLYMWHGHARRRASAVASGVPSSRGYALLPGSHRAGYAALPTPGRPSWAPLRGAPARPGSARDASYALLPTAGEGDSGL